MTRLDSNGVGIKAPTRFVQQPVITEPVKEWVEHDLPAARLRPLVAAVSQATKGERAAILNGLATLEQLLAHDGPQPGSS